MNRRPNLQVPGAIVSACLAIFSLSAMADEPDHTNPYAGFRPPSEYAQTFLYSLDTTTIAVLPTIIRRADRTAHSFASQEQIVRFLNQNGIAAATPKHRRVKMLPMQRVSQWNLFQYGLETVANTLQGYEATTDYTLVMEVLLPVDHAVFGIEVYILDQQSRNAFSFLLNSHHQMFVDANLYAKNESEEARIKMIDDATRVGLAALKQQIDRASKHAAPATASNRGYNTPLPVPRHRS